jgi:hypothetical protein
MRAEAGFSRRFIADIADRGVDVAVGRIPSLQWGVRERQDSAQKQTYANLADRSIASAISGISGVGEKRSSAGARTARASTRRPADW